MDSADYWRQLDFFNPNKKPIDATIVGCGGIGSFTALALAKLGIREMTLIDSDVVSRHNLPNQLLGKDDIGDLKVHSLTSIVSQLSDCQIAFSDKKFSVEDGEVFKFTTPLVISAVDSNKSRREIWEAGVKRNMGVLLFLDGRIGGEMIRILTVKNVTDSDQIAKYEATLTPDEKTAELPCTAQQVIDIGFLMASQMVRLTRKFFTGKPIPKELMISVDKAFSVMEIY